MNEQPLLIIGMGTILLTSILLVYYIYSLVLIDAQSRGIEKPKFWAVIASSGNGGQGILLYLFHRKEYNKNMSKADRETSDKLKRKIYSLLGVSLISFIFCVILIFNL